MSFFREKVFPLLSGAAWLTFLILDLTGGASSTWVKFAAICLCAVTAWTGAGTVDGKLVAAALTLTVCADWFLLVLDSNYLSGVLLFCLVQALYAIRLSRLDNNFTWTTFHTLALILHLFSPFTLLVGNLFFDGLTAYTLFYFFSLCANTAHAFALGKTLRIFAIGLLLFIGCDLCVGCWNMGLLGDFARVGMWLFYLPSQVLIVLSQDTKGAFQ